MSKREWNKYILVFVITSVMFFGGFFVSNYLSRKKIDNLALIEDKIAINILSLETQFDLLKESLCRERDDIALSKELGALENKISYAEDNLGYFDEQVIELKKYYSLLEIKDYLLFNKIKKECNSDQVSVLYFYSNKNDCEKCAKEGYILTHFRQKYPEIRVYSFDYHLDVSPVNTLISLYGVKNDLPAIMVNNNVYYGYMDAAAMEEIILPLLSSASTTPKEKSEEVYKKPKNGYNN